MLGRDDQHPRIINYQLLNTGKTLPVIFYEGEVWLNQKQIASVFGTRLSTVNEHLKKIVGSPQFPVEQYSHLFKVKSSDGKQYEVAHYRLEVVEEIDKRVRRS